MLSKHGEFHPFGAIMSSNGDIQLVAGKIKGDDHPPSPALIELLTSTFRQQAARGHLRAAGVCYDVLTAPPGENEKRDAICCGLEHYSGETVDVFLPYVKGTNGAVRYGDMFAAKRTPEFFRNIPSAD